ncbi:MAG: hypothetical protein KJO90_02050, partial [Eudoraea sp.]|nr:hypothetical protein [Eudoraea sp.]
MRTIKFYATTPESVTQAITKNKNINGLDYYKMVTDSAKWSEANGFHGTLIYSNNSLVDGLAVAQTIL